MKQSTSVFAAIIVIALICLGVILATAGPGDNTDRVRGEATSQEQETGWGEDVDDQEGDEDGDDVSEDASVTMPVPAEGTAPAGSEMVATPDAGVYTMAEVAVHGDASSCWTAIRGSVYDLTPWIDQHPGGKSAILGLCGVDGTAPFDRMHGGKARPEAELASFLIGTVK